MLTYNGNENILQNDMGNAQVMDAKTGNMIGLSDGFVPVGIKEHGGVLYIASYNPKTEKGELGTIPSPRIQYTLQDLHTEEIDRLIAGINQDDILIDYKVSSDYIPIDPETLFRVGDQFLVQLDLEHISLLRNENLLSYFNDTKHTPTLYTILLYSKTINGTYEKIDTPVAQVYYSNNDLKTSKYWFVPASENVNIEKTYKNPDLLLTYPNIPPGYLCVKVVVEKPQNIKIITNTTTNVSSPIYYIYE